jgi:hypothetical protein
VLNRKFCPQFIKTRGGGGPVLRWTCCWTFCPQMIKTAEAVDLFQDELFAEHFSTNDKNYRGGGAHVLSLNLLLNILSTSYKKLERRWCTCFKCNLLLNIFSTNYKKKLERWCTCFKLNFSAEHFVHKL